MAMLIGGFGILLGVIVVLMDVAHKNNWSVLKVTAWMLSMIAAWLALVVVAS